MKRPFVVGICGGIGSGKSAATRAFERLGAHVIDADRIAHEVLDEPPVRAAIGARFGPAAIHGGAVNRGALAAAVFGPTEANIAARRDLERIVHPRILFQIESRLSELRAAAHPPQVVVLDVPLLHGTPLAKDCDEIVFVDAAEAARIERTRITRGWSESEHRAREAAQTPLETRRKTATHVIDNRGSLADLEHACEALYRAWVAAS